MTADLQLTISNLWILIATAMVFIMHLGFAALEADSPVQKIPPIFCSRILALFPLGYCHLLL